MAAKRLRRIGLGLLFAVVVEYFVLPQLAGARKTLGLLSGAHPLLLLVALALEAIALLAYASLTMALLPEPRPGLSTVMRIQLSTLAVSHVVPGGAAAGAGIAVDLYKDASVGGADAGFALATGGLGSAVVLNGLLWLGLVVSIPAHGFQPLYGTAALLGAFIIGVFIALIVLLTRGEVRTASVVHRVAMRVRFIDEAVVTRAAHHVADRLRALGRDRRMLARAIGWAVANWMFDAAALWMCLAAFGAAVSFDRLVVAYCLANVVAALPITPGGLGVMEAVLTAALVGFGSGRGVAILGVVIWRLFSFWLPIPVGAAAYLSLKLGARRDRAAGIAELRRLAERADAEAESSADWADRHGLRPSTRLRNDRVT